MKKLIGLAIGVLVFGCSALMAASEVPCDAKADWETAKKKADDLGKELKTLESTQPKAPSGTKPAEAEIKNATDEMKAKTKARTDADSARRDADHQVSQVQASATPNLQAHIDQLTADIDQININLAKATNAQESIDRQKLADINAARVKIAALTNDIARLSKIIDPLIDRKSRGGSLLKEEDDMLSQAVAEKEPLVTQLAQAQKDLAQLYPDAETQKLLDSIPALLKDQAAKTAEKAKLDKESAHLAELKKKYQEASDAFTKADAEATKATDTFNKVDARAKDWKEYSSKSTVWSTNYQAKKKAKDAADLDEAAKHKVYTDTLARAVKEKDAAIKSANDLLAKFDAAKSNLKTQLDNAARTKAAQEKKRLQAELNALKGKPDSVVKNEKEKILHEWASTKTEIKNTRDQEYRNGLSKVRQDSKPGLLAAKKALDPYSCGCFPDVSPVVERLDKAIMEGDNASVGDIIVDHLPPLDYGELDTTVSSTTTALAGGWNGTYTMPNAPKLPPAPYMLRVSQIGQNWSVSPGGITYSNVKVTGDKLTADYSFVDPSSSDPTPTTFHIEATVSGNQLVGRETCSTGGPPVWTKDFKLTRQ